MRVGTGLRYAGTAMALMLGAAGAHRLTHKLGQKERREGELLRMVRDCRDGAAGSCQELRRRVEGPCNQRRDPYACFLLAPLDEKGGGPGCGEGQIRGRCASAAAHYAVACAGGFDVACTILRNHYEVGGDFLGKNR